MEDSDVRQAQLENLTESVLGFTKGIGVIKTHNLLGEEAKTFADSFKETCRTSLAFEEEHTPWQRGLNLIYGLGTALAIGFSVFLHGKGMPGGICRQFVTARENSQGWSRKGA